MTEMDLNQAQARAGIPAIENPHVELCCPTVFDPSLAPPGKHIVTIDMNSQPYTLRDGSSWDDIKDEVGDGHRPDRPLLPQPPGRHRA